ncbi:MAG: histidine kinase dimerization/phosphoacceptor domain -containing protein [Pseudomonadota bacterium]
MTVLNDIAILGRALMAATPHSYLVLDTDHRIVEVSDAYLKMTEASRSDLIGLSIYEAFPDNPDDPSGMQDLLGASLNRASKTREPDEIEVRHPIPVRDTPGHFVNRWWWVNNSAMVVDGKVVGFLHSARDITDIVFARRDVEIKERLAEQLSNLAYWQYTPSLGQATASQSLWEMFEIPLSDNYLDQDVLFGRYVDGDAERQINAFEALEDAPVGSVIEGEYQIDLPKAGLRWIHMRGELIRENPQDPASFVGMAMDITGTKNREVELAKTVDDRDALLAQKELLLDEVNHRIKNSLQIVSSILNVDARKAYSDEATKRLTGAAQRVQAVASVHELIYKAGQVTTVNLEGYLQQLCASLENSSQGTITCEADEITLITDKAISLALLVNELVANSFEHGIGDRTDGLIEVKCVHETSNLVLSVTDNGDGKSDETTEGLGSFITGAMVMQLDGIMTEGPPKKQIGDGSHKGHQVLVHIPMDE